MQEKDVGMWLRGLVIYARESESVTIFRASFHFLYMLLALATTVHAAPVTVNGDPFTLVATQSNLTQLFGLAADGTGKIYIGNNSNTTSGIPLQVFDPTLFSGAPISLSNFGPALGDADGMSYFGGNLYVADRDEGLQKIAVPAAAATLFQAGLAINGTGSPIVVRPSDGHVFVGLGGLTGVKRIDEYDASGNFVASHTTGTDVETMTYDVATGRIYYAAFGSSVRALDPTTNTDVLVGNSSGTIDGGLTFDPISGLLFVGTANGINSGLVETINTTTGVATLFASGFLGSTGILRDPYSGALYFLGTNTINNFNFDNALYRIDSSKVPNPVPLPPSLALFFAGLASFAFLGRSLKRPAAGSVDTVLS